MEFEVIKGKVEIPEISKKGRGIKPYHPVTLALIDWLDTDSKMLKLKGKSMQEARSAYTLLCNYRSNHKLDYTIYKRGLEVYCVRA